MAKNVEDKYGYFIRGRQLVIVEYGIDDVYVDGAPNYTAPKSSIANGLMLEYTAIDDLSEVLTEKDSIPVHDTLALAIVDYVKAQLIDDVEDFRKKEYHMAKFKDRIAKYTNARIGGIRRVLGNGAMR